MSAAHCTVRCTPATISPLEPVLGSGERELARLAKRQRGLLDRSQLLAAGLTTAQIRGRLRDLRLTSVYRGIYALGAELRDGPLVRETAVAMRYLNHGVISHLSAAFIWQMVQARPDVVDVTVVGPSNGSAPPGVHCHRVVRLGSQELRRRQGLPITSPARTLIDIAGDLDMIELEGALGCALAAGLVRVREVRAALDRAPGNAAGVGKLRALLDSGNPAEDLRSKYEAKLLALIRAAELPPPVANVKIGTLTVDLYWPDQRLVVEFDSWSFHRDREAFERDRLRDQKLTAGGERVLRVTARQTDHTPFALIARLSAALHH